LAYGLFWPLLLVGSVKNRTVQSKTRLFSHKLNGLVGKTQKTQQNQAFAPGFACLTLGFLPNRPDPINPTGANPTRPRQLPPNNPTNPGPTRANAAPVNPARPKPIAPGIFGFSRLLTDPTRPAFVGMRPHNRPANRPGIKPRANDQPSTIAPQTGF